MSKLVSRIVLDEFEQEFQKLLKLLTPVQEVIVVNSLNLLRRWMNEVQRELEGMKDG